MAPTVSVVPGLGVEIIVLSFAVVVIGGLGSLPGAALGALIVGLVRSISVHYMPEVELFVIYFVMAMVPRLPPARPLQPGRAEENLSRDRTADFTPLVIGAILVVLLAAAARSSRNGHLPSPSRSRRAWSRSV